MKYHILAMFVLKKIKVMHFRQNRRILPLVYECSFPQEDGRLHFHHGPMVIRGPGELIIIGTRYSNFYSVYTKEI